MLERIKNIKSSSAGIATGIIAVAGLLGYTGLSQDTLIVILGLLGSVIGLFAKD